MSDGTVKVETSLDNSGIEKDLKKVENTIQNSGKKIQSTMDNVEKSMKKANSAFDGSKIAKQLDNVGKSIDKAIINRKTSSSRFLLHSISGILS